MQDETQPAGEVIDPANDPCNCFPHGPNDPCTCDGCWACNGHEIGCSCDIAWDCEHRTNHY